MKKTDIAMIILIATVCVLGAFFVTRSILGEPGSETVNVKTVERIDASITDPDPSIFNEDAINPAVQVELNNDTQQ